VNNAFHTTVKFLTFKRDLLGEN